MTTLEQNIETVRSIVETGTIPIEFKPTMPHKRSESIWECSGCVSGFTAYGKRLRVIAIMSGYPPPDSRQ